MIVKIGKIELLEKKLTLVEVNQRIDLDDLIMIFGELTILVIRPISGIIEIVARGGLENLISTDILNDIEWKEINLEKK